MSLIVFLSLVTGICILLTSHLIARRLSRFYSPKICSLTFLFVAALGLYYLYDTSFIWGDFYFWFWLFVIIYELTIFFLLLLKKINQ